MTENNLFWKLFSRRSAICFFVMMLLFFSCILRVASLTSGDYSSAGAEQNRIKITVAKQRGTIYDCNMIPLTNADKKTVAAISPTPRAVAAISTVLKGEELNSVLERLKSGKPVLAEVDEAIKCDGIICTEVYGHSNGETPAIHLLGYTDSDLKGVSGIEAAYDSILYCEEEVYISYECDGKGRILEGAKPVLQNDTSVISGGVISTVDINIQTVAESAAKHIDKGAVVIAESATGKIRACVSRPFFDCTKTAEYLEKENSPLLNRAINAYNVGSVFKPCVAISGIENSKSGFCYTCTGSCEIIDRHFKCHKPEGHGYMNLKSAIANSCNTYFYNFAFSIGKDAIYNTARSLRFGMPLDICDGISTSAGSLPDLPSLKNIAYLANFSIGQGKLLLSPVSILTLYNSIASDGSYYVPSVVEGTIQNGSLKKYDIGKPTRVMKPATAKLLREYLEAVLTEGTGEAARPQNVTAAGKTATAQTGKFENGTEICGGWFCGFFPAENPEYTVAVFSENTKEQDLSCAEIFRFIADNVSKIKNIG